MKTQVVEKPVVRCTDVNSEDVRHLMLLAGTRIGSVWFKKRSDGSIRKMCYRLHVSRPRYAASVRGRKRNRDTLGRLANMRSQKIITVFDVNKVVRDSNGKVMYDNGRICRGAWRTVPLDGVFRVCAGGAIYWIDQ